MNGSAVSALFSIYGLLVAGGERSAGAAAAAADPWIVGYSEFKILLPPDRPANYDAGKSTRSCVYGRARLALRWAWPRPGCSPRLHRLTSVVRQPVTVAVFR